jgi:hypothetical protein
MKKLIVFLLVASVSAMTMSTLTGCGKTKTKTDVKSPEKSKT